MHITYTHSLSPTPAGLQIWPSGRTPFCGHFSILQIYKIDITQEESRLVLVYIGNIIFPCVSMNTLVGDSDPKFWLFFP